MIAVLHYNSHTGLFTLSIDDDVEHFPSAASAHEYADEAGLDLVDLTQEGEATPAAARDWGFEPYDSLHY